MLECPGGGGGSGRRFKLGWKDHFLKIQGRRRLDDEDGEVDREEEGDMKDNVKEEGKNVPGTRRADSEEEHGNRPRL